MGPDSSKTFGQLIAELGEAVGFPSYDGDGKLAATQDPYLLDRFKRRLSSALSLLQVEEGPWYCLRRPHSWTLSTDGTDPRCVGGSPTTYLLPWWAGGGPIGRLAWGMGQDTRSGLLRHVHADEVRAWNLSNPSSGPPCMVAIEPADMGIGKTTAWHAIIAPTPDAAYTIHGVFQAKAPAVDVLGGRHPFGDFLDELVLAAAKWCDVRDSMDNANFRLFQAEYARLLAKGKAQDVKRNAPREVGEDQGNSGYSEAALDPYGRGGVTSVNGIQIN